MAISPHLRCDDAVEFANEYLERTLPGDDAESFEHHLLICSACAEYVGQLRAIRDVAPGMRAEEPPSEDSVDGVLASFRALTQRNREEP